MKIEHKVLSKPVIEAIRVIDKELRNTHKKVNAAIHIKLRGATLNKTGRYDLHALYLPLLREGETRAARRETNWSCLYD